MDAKAFVTGEINREAEFVLKKFGFDKPELLEELKEGDELIVVDTNNPDELIKGHDKAELLEIVDHHKLAGGLSTPGPISFTIRPYACTMTVMWEIINSEKVVEIPKEMAGIMLAAILSDTLNFTSPTTTEMDKRVADDLASMAEVEMEELASEMFEAKSDLSGMSGKDILLSDSKIFALKGNKMRIAVLETTKPENSLKMLDELKKAAEELKKEEGLDGLFFFTVDILNTKSHLIVFGDMEEELAKKAFGEEFENGVMELDGVVSRKKQMVPGIEKVL